MEKKIIWKANQVISIETKKRDENRKDNVYVLAQMINKAQLLVFNLFNTDNQWDNVDLQNAPILFCTYVTKQFLKCSNIYKQNIKGLENYVPPTYRIRTLGMGVRNVKVWAGTPDEKEVMILGSGGATLVDGDVNGPVIIPLISDKDDKVIDNYEMANVRISPEFNERLYLCYKFGKNVDPLKDLVFNRDIPKEYKEYIDIITYKGE